MAWFFSIAIFFVSFDRLFKAMSLQGFDFNIIGEIFRFSFAKNYFIAFSLPITGMFLIIFILIILIILLIFCLKMYYRGKIVDAGLISILIVGAMSNLFDRLKYGYVIDYLDLDYFTVFNLADVMIVLASAGLILPSLKCFFRKQKID